ncbi:MAG: M1 family aminopeptidase [Bacteroidota bacterium]
MKTTASLLFLLIFISTACEQQQTELTIVEKGVSLQLATERKQKISDVVYKLFFEIPEDKAEPIPATLSLSFKLSDSSQPLVLDFKEKKENLNSISIGETSVPYDFTNEHVIINPENLKAGVNQLDFSFTAGDLSLNRNDDFLYTLLVPDRARTLFPVFDQPNIKAKYALTLSIPQNWEAVSNGKALDERNSGNRKTVVFEETKVISSYLFAFATGKFSKRTDEGSGMTMYYREQDQEKVDRNAPEIFAIHSKSLKWLEEYTGVPYPYVKFDFVLIPPFQYGGMEHPGNVFYRESTLMLDEGASINQKLRRASLIAHETAHMWFGNLVTMDWFNDVWLKEVFANQMASKIMNPEFPEIDHELNFLLSYYPRAMKVDRTAGSHPIQQPLGNLQNAGTLYGNIIYNKAPIIMRNLEDILGEEAFKDALTEYLKTYYEKNATWDDLISIMKGYTEKDLSKWSSDWVQVKGAPVYEYQVDEQKSVISFTQKQDVGDQIWPQKIAYTSSKDVGKQYQVFLDRKQVNAPFQIGNQPSMINTDGRGYGYFRVSQTDWESQYETYGKSEKAITRAAFWLNSWEGVLHNDLQPLLVFEKLMEAVSQEKNPLVIADNLNIMSTIFWQYLDEEEKSKKGEQVEKQLLERILVEEDASIKKTLYRNLISLTYSKSGGEQLYEIWKSKGSIIDLNLSESELVTLAYHVKLRQVEGANNVLNEQLSLLKNVDRVKRMKFIIPALSANEADRDAFFESLKIPGNRASEPWVIEAISFLHHPLRQKTSAKYVEESLQMIKEIQETGIPDVLDTISAACNTLSFSFGDKSGLFCRKVFTVSATTTER